MTICVQKCKSDPFELAIYYRHTLNWDRCGIILIKSQFSQFYIVSLIDVSRHCHEQNVWNSKSGKQTFSQLPSILLPNCHLFLQNAFEHSPWDHWVYMPKVIRNLYAFLTNFLANTRHVYTYIDCYSISNGDSKYSDENLPYYRLTDLFAQIKNRCNHHCLQKFIHSD